MNALVNEATQALLEKLHFSFAFNDVLVARDGIVESYNKSMRR